MPKARLLKSQTEDFYGIAVWKFEFKFGSRRYRMDCNELSGTACFGYNLYVMGTRYNPHAFRRVNNEHPDHVDAFTAGHELIDLAKVKAVMEL